MEELKKMIRAVVNAQSALKAEMIGRFDLLDKKIDGVELRLTKRIDNNRNRIDKLGKSIAYLEDDTPTREEFDELSGKVAGLGSKTQ